MTRFTDSHLYVYQCKVCKTVATTASKHPYGDPLRCNLCYSFMTFQYGTPITTAAQQAIADRGVLYNPGIERKQPKRCEAPGCRYHVGYLYGVEIDGVGAFCSKACAAVGVKRHEAAMAKPTTATTGVNE